MKQAEFPAHDCWLRHRVSYGETDAMGVVYYAEYLHFFERARSQYIRDAGMSYAEVEERGIYLPVVQAGCRYRLPSRFDELLLVRAGISEWKRASIVFAYEIWDEAKAQMRVTGMTEHATVSREGKPVRVPEWLRELFPG